MMGSPGAVRYRLPQQAGNSTEGRGGRTGAHLRANHAETWRKM